MVRKTDYSILPGVPVVDEELMRLHTEIGHEFLAAEIPEGIEIPKDLTGESYLVVARKSGGFFVSQTLPDPRENSFVKAIAAAYKSLSESYKDHLDYDGIFISKEEPQAKLSAIHVNVETRRRIIEGYDGHRGYDLTEQMNILARGGSELEEMNRFRDATLEAGRKLKALPEVPLDFTDDQYWPRWSDDGVL